MSEAFLVLTILLSSGRNIVSKGMTQNLCGKKDFFFGQMLLFFFGGLIILVSAPQKALFVPVEVFPYSIVYGLLLFLAQGLYTLALKTGNTSVCALVYSFGFLIPTVAGSIFWSEPFGINQYIGLALAIATLFLTTSTEKREGVGKSYLLPLFGAALSSGGLGVMQKVQQSAAISDRTHGFLFYAFVVAFLISVVGFLTQRGTGGKPQKSFSVRSATAGICFGGANYLNTVLAGKMASSIFFPVQNIGTLTLSVLLSVLIFKEKISRRKAAGLILGVVTILVLKIKL